jgi:hypothetical protein
VLPSTAPREAVPRRRSSKVPPQRIDDDGNNKVPPAAGHLPRIPGEQWKMSSVEATASDDTNSKDGFDLAGSNRCPYFALHFCGGDKVHDRRLLVIVVDNVGALLPN